MAAETAAAACRRLETQHAPHTPAPLVLWHMHEASVRLHILCNFDFAANCTPHQHLPSPVHALSLLRLSVSPSRGAALTAVMAGESTSYRALPVRLGRSKLVRHLFLKPHAGLDSLPKDRTLFVAGLPVELDEGALLELCSRFGPVERAAIHASRVSAVVLWEAAAGRDAALKAAARGAVQHVDLPERTAPFGLKGKVWGAYKKA